MRILGFIILLSSVGITYTVAQRRHQNAAEVQPDTQTNPTGATLRGRGRARFVKTPEFEQVSSDYTAASRTTASEGKTRSLPGAGTIRHNSIRKPSGSNTRRLYEVQEFVDDIPDRSAPSSVYHRPRVITEDKFEIPNAPRSKLFEPETNPNPQVNDDELIKTFGSLRSDEPTKLELPQVLSLSENDQEPNGLSSTTSREETSSEELSSSSTTEAEMGRELLKKQQPESGSTTTEVTSSTATPVRRTIIRSRNNAARQLNSESGPTTSATVPARTRGRSRLTAPTDSASAPSLTRSRPTETPTESESSAPRGSFRVGRRRPISNLKDRGPSVVEEDSQAPKTRTGRDSVSQYTSRRGSVRNTTPRLSEPAVEATTRNRADIRRSRGRKFESATNVPTENAPVNNGNRPTEFTSRRTRTRAPVAQEQRASSRIDNVASSRSFSEPIRSRNQPEPSATTAPRDSRARTRSRFQLSDIENVKLEPQQSIEHSTRAIPRRQGRTRPPLIQNEELVASSTVENPIRVTLPSTSTIRSVNSIPTRIKESVHSEVSEVISSRKVTRRKKPTAKASVTKKSQEVEDDIDELNYPPQFKAIILANQSKTKDDKKLDSASLSSSLNGISSSVIVESTSTTPLTTTTSIPSSTTSPAPLTTSTLFQVKHVEDVDNDLAPTPRPTRRRFSVSTRKPNSEGVTSSRKPKTLPTRKLVAHPDPEKIAKFHARFNTQSQRENTSNDPVVSTTTTKRTTKAPSKLSYTRKSDKLTDRKVYQAPTKTNRYSSRYRSETRSSVPTRAATTSPIYIPTVPTVTPGSVFAPSSHQAPKTYDEDDDIKIISIAQPKANSLYSDNLVTENNTTVNSSDTTNSPTVSIIERIINSISSISTTSTAKPTGVSSTTETAILRIPPSPKKKVEENNRIQKELTTEKPTTIIERILNSLSAIQASDNNVGTTGTAGNNFLNDLDSNLVVPIPQRKPSTSSTTSTTTTTTLRTTTTIPSTTTTLRTTTTIPSTTTPFPKTTSTVKVAPAPTRLPSQSTVAISLADYLASLGLGTTQRSSGVTSTTLPATTTTSVDLNKNTIDYLETTTKSSTTNVLSTTMAIPSTTIFETTTKVPTTTFRAVTTTQRPTTTVNWLGRLLGLDTTVVPTTRRTTTMKPTTTTKPLTTTMNIDTTTNIKMETSTTPQTTSTMMPESSTQMSESTTITANALNLDITTPVSKVSPNSVTVTSPNDVNNKNLENVTTNSNNRTGKAFADDLNNAITTKNNNATNAPTTTPVPPEDYFIFGVLPNNTIVRKRPRKLSAPYFIYGVYPNNTIVRKFPNGTIVPEDPVVQVSGFDTRDPLPPSPMITNRVTEPEGTDDARNSTEIDDQISNELNNETLTGKTLKEYTKIINQTVTLTTTASTITTTESAMSTTPVSVTSTQQIASELDDLNTIITERAIDLTTLNIPMMIELGPTTENSLSEKLTTVDDSTTGTTNASTEDAEDLSTFGTTTEVMNEITTILNDVNLESRNLFETNEEQSIDEMEDTTLPMPDTSTIVMTSTSATAETTTTTTTPDIILTTDMSSSTPISTIWTVNPSSIRTTLSPTSNDDLENEIKQSRVIEITPSSTTTVPSVNSESTTTSTSSDISSTLRFTETPSTMPTTIRPNTWFSTPITTIANWLSTTPLPTTMFATRKITTTTPAPTTTTTALPTTTKPPTTTPTTTTTQATTTFRTTTTPTTTVRTTTTTDLTTFIANLLSTLRPVYTPTTLAYPTTTETTTAPTITITARRRTTSTTTPQPTTTRNSGRRRTIATTTVPPTTEATTSVPVVTNIVSNTIPTTTFKLETTTLDPRNVDIDELVKRSKKPLTSAQLQEIEQLKALEREQANLLQQLSLLTNLNLNGQAQKPGSANLANRIIQFAKDRDQTTDIPTTEIPTTRIPKKLPALDSKGTTVEDIIRDLNAIQNSGGENSVANGKSQEAIIAEILKQRGIVPSTPKSLGDAFKPTTPPTTRRPRTTTTPRPGRIMQGLSWLLNQFTGPQEPPPRPRPVTQRPTTTTRATTKATTTTTQKQDFDELHFQSTEVNNVIHSTPQSRLKRPVNSLTDEELSRLIKQLEAIQKDPKQAQNLDITPFRKLQQIQTTTLNNKDVEIFTTGGSNQGSRSQKAIEQQNGRVRTIKSTTSNSIEDLEDENEVTTARVRTTRPTTRTRATLPPVSLNPVPGIEDNSAGSQIGGNFLNAAVNVTRAISTFLGAAIQGAARSFQSVIGSGSSSTGGLFRASSG